MKTNQTCCFTGHRRLPQEKLPDIVRQLEAIIENLIAQGVIYYGCGGAIGFDLLAGETVLKLKKKYLQIKLIMVLPCIEQDKQWRQSDKDRYRILLEACDKLVYVQREYDGGCMFKRNRHLVDCSGVCVAYLTHQQSGSGYIVGYAQSKKVPVIHVEVSPCPPFIKQP